MDECPDHGWRRLHRPAPGRLPGRPGDVAVTVFDNESLGNRKHLDLDRVRFILGDLRNRDELRAALEGQDVVVHLAADTRVMESIENPAHNFDYNVVGTLQPPRALP